MTTKTAKSSYGKFNSLTRKELKNECKHYMDCPYTIQNMLRHIEKHGTKIFKMRMYHTCFDYSKDVIHSLIKWRSISFTIRDEDLPLYNCHFILTWEYEDFLFSDTTYIQITIQYKPPFCGC